MEISLKFQGQIILYSTVVGYYRLLDKDVVEKQYAKETWLKELENYKNKCPYIGFRKFLEFSDRE
jgi:hypothetical protein